MKHLRPFCAAAALTFVLALSSYAGEMGHPVCTPPPPRPETCGDTHHPATGEEPSGDAAAVNRFTDIALTLMQSAFLAF